MLSPSSIPPDLIPSTFLPPLPRSQLSFDPLTPADLLAHIAILRELYIPPIHGGFSARDYNRIADNGGDRERKRAKERRFSAGLSETMDGLGLGLGLGLDTGGAVAPKLPVVEDLPEHEHEDPLRPVRGNAKSDSEEYDHDEDEDEINDMDDDDESEQLHLDPFEREWAEKWLGGVVRRAQSWLEANEPDEDGKSPSLSTPSTSLSPGKIGLKVGAVEMVLRDATAVLAMMAGTSAAGSFTRHLLFPLHPSLSSGLRTIQSSLLANPAHSPQTSTFLASLAISPSSPTNSFLHSKSPTTSTSTFNRRRRTSEMSTSPTSSLISSGSASGSIQLDGPRRTRRKSRRPPAVPILLHDAPMQDHLSVGVQTWGSAILLGRQMALHPAEFGLFQQRPVLTSSFVSASASGNKAARKRGVRVLELGAGTGLLSILCRKLLDLHQASQEPSAPRPLDGDVTVPASPRARARQVSANGGSTNGGRNEVTPEDDMSGLVVATDFLPEVLENLKVCVDLNFPPKMVESVQNGISIGGTNTYANARLNESHSEKEVVIESTTDVSDQTGIHIAKLDWKSFPSFMEKRSESYKTQQTDTVDQTSKGTEPDKGDLLGPQETADEEETSKFMYEPFDLVLASDCVYDVTHAALLRKVASWVVRLPEEGVEDDQGGTFHILSPIRPTFTPELESIDTSFPLLSSYPPLSKRRSAVTANVASPASIQEDLIGEGLGLGRGLKLGVRGNGKKSASGRKGEGRTDESGGYWWWEVGWG